MLLVVQEAVLGPHHDRDLTQMHIGKETDVGFADAVSSMIDECGGDFHIHVQGGGIGKIAKARVVGHHRVNRAVVFKDGGFADGDFLKLEGNLVFMLYFSLEEGNAVDGLL